MHVVVKITRCHRVLAAYNRHEPDTKSQSETDSFRLSSDVVVLTLRAKEEPETRLQNHECNPRRYHSHLTVLYGSVPNARAKTMTVFIIEEASFISRDNLKVRALRR